MERKDKLLVLTYADKKLKSTNLLLNSCKANGLKLEVLTHSPWTANSLKIKLLYDFLKTKDENLIVLFADAFDVLIQEDEKTILKKFNSLNTDVLFSGEANFSFNDSRFKKEYWKKYPRGETIFDYLNAGSCIGNVSGLLFIFTTMIKEYKFPIDNETNLLKIKSDQDYFHRFYVDNYYKTENCLIAKIDRNQILLGCTGGRMTAKIFSEHSKTQSYYFFKIERKLLKLLRLNQFQNKAKDYEVEKGVFLQKQTKIKPSVMHFPGTFKAFDNIVNELLSEEAQPQQKSLKRSLAIFISYLSQTLSVIISFFIKIPHPKYQNRTQKDLRNTPSSIR